MNDFMFINEFKNSYSRSSPKQTSPAATSINRDHRMTNMIWKHKKVPRPRNAFMLYLQNVRSNIITKDANLHNKDISRIAGELWKRETSEVQKYFKRKADEEKLLHSLAHPGYKYCPQQKKRDHISSHRERVTDMSCQASKNSETTTGTYHNQDTLASSPPSRCLDATIVQAFFDDHTTYALYYDDAY